MAGDWIKMEVRLPDKPEVWQMAGILSIDPDSVVGKLLRVWAWFDSHTEDGNAVGVSFPLVDRIAGVTGFAEAMALSGWLNQNGHLLSLPNFQRHNGKTAKNRALTNERVAKHRNAGVTLEALPKPLPEKRREEKILEREPRASRLPPEFKPQGEFNALEFEKFRDYWIAQPGQKGVKADWDATWRNWVRKAKEFSPKQETRSAPSVADSQSWLEQDRIHREQVRAEHAKRQAVR